NGAQLLQEEPGVILGFGDAEIGSAAPGQQGEVNLTYYTQADLEVSILVTVTADDSLQGVTAGAPVENVTVELHLADEEGDVVDAEPEDVCAGALVTSDTTDADGQVTFAAVVGETYCVIAYSEGEGAGDAAHVGP